MSKRRRVVGDTVSDSTGPDIALQTSCTADDVFNHSANRAPVLGKCAFDASPSPSPAMSSPSSSLSPLDKKFQVRVRELTKKSSSCVNIFFLIFMVTMLKLSQASLGFIFCLYSPPTKCESAERCNLDQVDHCFQLNKSAKRFRSSKRTTSDKNKKRKVKHNKKHKMCKP